ncbi:hypothetical protein BABINDRAFT_160574 [Babjeviella inositovora NRRL Y-12698]|uniref:Protein-serine/threonine kinase n=1 Tax=Babjeviella inositovora NRRL Y-12698 TaxID=984486 RepID=A0A1E3QVS2_9ASCO|nr:uncharacterized protein BABINDRAFT_160574 [Babjeviella inositovora NRRL Y-12698]ODQ81182.1 hypothetical protein BABINDRAFT_160574 [Babjeviella inositovora NRRL Y-12698]
MPTIERFARFKPSKVNLSQLIKFGVTPSTPQIYRSSQFLLDEIPIMLAHRVQLLRNPPPELTVKQPFRNLADSYEHTFHKILEFKQKSSHLLGPEMKARLLSQSSPAGMYFTTRVSDETGPEPVILELSASQVLSSMNVVSAVPAPGLFARLSGMFHTRSFAVAPNVARANPAHVQFDPNLRQTLSDTVRAYPQEVHSYNALCQEFFSAILADHSNDLIALFKEVNQELFQMKITRPKQYARKCQIDNCTRTHEYLNALHRSRISTRFLVSQHQSLYKLSYAQVSRAQFKELQRNGNVGVIATNVSIYDILNDAITSAENTLINWTGLNPPEIILNCDDDLRTVCVPAHLWHIFFELVKNAMRATLENYNDASISSDGKMRETGSSRVRDTLRKDIIPPIEITVLNGTEDVLIKISDRGGGIKSSELSKISSYFYTTVSNDEISQFPVDSMTHPNSGNEVFNLVQNPNQDLQDGKAAPLAGLGYGLPLSKLYAQHFGGDLKLVSLWGYGTDAFVRLNKFGLEGS